jgi:hypothetical protein
LEGRGEEEVGKVASSALPSRRSQCTSLSRGVTMFGFKLFFRLLVVAVLVCCAKGPPWGGPLACVLEGPGGR